MNRLTTKEIARLVYESTKGKKEEGIGKAMPKIAQMVVRFGMQEKVNAIISEFEKIWLEKEGMLKVKIEVVEKLDKEAIEKIRDFVSKSEKVVKEKVLIEEMTNPQIKGGIRLQIGDKVFDQTIEGKLEKMRKLF